MTSPSDRPNTALLVIDMQNDVVGGAYETARVVANINSLITKARAEGVPVVWVQHADEGLVADTDGWKIVADLVPGDGEALVHKNYGDSFAATDLESILASADLGRLVVTGAQTDACIRSTLHGALTRGYDVTLVGDAHTTEDMREWGSPIGPDQAIEYTNLYWSFSKTDQGTGGTVSTSDVEFAAGEPPTLISSGRSPRSRPRCTPWVRPVRASCRSCRA